MKTLAFISLLQLCCALAVKRDDNPLEDFTKPRDAATPYGAMLAGLTDFEALLKKADPEYGPILRNPKQVVAIASAKLNTAKLDSQSVGTPKLRKDAKRATFRYGPFEMLAKGLPKPQEPSPHFPSLDPNGQGWLFLFDEGLCKNCTILRAIPGISFKDGTPATPEQGYYLHHTLIGEISEPGLNPVSFCDQPKANPSTVLDLVSHPFIRGFSGSGTDNGDTGILYTSPDGKLDTGFQIGESHTMMVQADFVNYSNKTTDLYMTLDVEYLDGHLGASSVVSLVSVTGCKIQSPKASISGPTITKSEQFPILTDGVLISTKGHLHNGGDRMILGLNGKEVCVSSATYDDATGNIKHMNGCDLGLPVKRGDYLTMESVYDLVAHPPRKGVTGGHAHNIMGGNDLMGFWTMTFGINNNTRIV